MNNIQCTNNLSHNKQKIHQREINTNNAMRTLSKLNSSLSSKERLIQINENSSDNDIENSNINVNDSQSNDLYIKEFRRLTVEYIKVLGIYQKEKEGQNTQDYLINLLENMCNKLSNITDVI